MLCVSRSICGGSRVVLPIWGAISCVAVFFLFKYVVVVNRSTIIYIVVVQCLKYLQK